MIKNVLKTVFK